MTAEFQLIGSGPPDRAVRRFRSSTEGEATRRVVVLRDVTEARSRELLRDAFLSLLSHELRTPMTAVYGGATLLQRMGDELDSATRNDVRADIVSEAERLSRLIDDLLVLTRVEGGVEVGQEPALLQHLVAEVAAQDQRRQRVDPIERRRLTPGLAPVTGDETSIRQVTHNLISNAVKYSPTGRRSRSASRPGTDEVARPRPRPRPRPVGRGGRPRLRAVLPRLGHRRGWQPASASACSSASAWWRPWAGGSGPGRVTEAAPSSGSPSRSGRSTRTTTNSPGRPKRPAGRHA